MGGEEKAYREVTLALATFEKAKDWADLHNALRRLSETLGKFHNKYGSDGRREIPASLLVCKRLSQCLSPALPAGVHEKALEIYSEVFGRLDTALGGDALPEFTAGLLPLLPLATNQVKMKMIDLISKHYVKLGRDLVPALTGLLVALFSGMDEEGSQISKDITAVIDKMRSSVGNDPDFFRGVWTAFHLSASARLPATNYLLKRLPAQIATVELASYLPDRPVLVVVIVIVLGF